MSSQENSSHSYLPVHSPHELPPIHSPLPSPLIGPGVLRKHGPQSARARAIQPRALAYFCMLFDSICLVAYRTTSLIRSQPVASARKAYRCPTPCSLRKVTMQFAVPPYPTSRLRRLSRAPRLPGRLPALPSTSQARRPSAIANIPPSRQHEGCSSKHHGQCEEAWMKERAMDRPQMLSWTWTIRPHRSIMRRQVLRTMRLTCGSLPPYAFHTRSSLSPPGSTRNGTSSESKTY